MRESAGKVAVEEARAGRAVAASRGGAAGIAWKPRPTIRWSATALSGLGILLLVVLMAILAPIIAPHEPNRTDLAINFRPPLLLGGTSEYVLGTDHLGRDVLSRLLYGAQVSVMVGIFAVLISGFVGVLLGLVAGFYGRWIDDLLMRLVDILLAFPFILLAIVVMVAVGGNLLNVILLLAFTRWVDYSRVVRAETLAMKEREFILAARATGADNGLLIRRHILPNVFTPVIVMATFSVAQMIVAEASLSFLGVGIQPPTSTWGGMLADARLYLRSAWWLATLPGLAIMLTVLAANLVGDWVRDLLDPTLTD